MSLSAGWEAIRVFIHAYDELKTAFSAAEILKMSFNNSEDAKVFQIMVYKGFNHRAILRKVMQAHAAWTPATTTPDKFVIKSGDGTEMEFSSTASLMEDVKNMVTLFVMRGNNKAKITNKSCTGMKEYVAHLEKKLGVSMTKNASGSALDPEVVTMPRLTACFPLRAIELTIAGFAKLFCTLVQIGVDPSVSKAILSPYFNGFIPSPEGAEAATWVSPHVVFFLVHVHLDNTIHRKPGEQVTTLEQILVYYLASFRSPILPNLKRKELCKEFDLVTLGTGGTPTPNFRKEITDAIPFCKAELARLRPNEDSATIITTLDSLKE